MVLPRALVIAAVLCRLLHVDPVSAATEITSCEGDHRGTVSLSGDLDCTGSTYGHLRFANRGRLLLNGFTLTGGVTCVSCTVIGPGTVTGNDSASAGVRGTLKATVINVNLTGNGSGVVAHTFDKRGKVFVRDSTITGNAFHGIEADRVVKVQDSTISGNGVNGIDVPCDERVRIVVKDSTLSANGSDPNCGVAISCADIAQGRCDTVPRLVGDASCETSYVIGSGLPGSSFGICSFDLPPGN